jgi:hypothetical protein
VLYGGGLTLTPDFSIWRYSAVIPSAETSGKYVPRYYESLGRAHDYLMRCKDCQRLVVFSVLSKLGCCDGCGTRKMAEITILSEQEMADIKSGAIDFPDRDLFLKEFNPVEAK